MDHWLISKTREFPKLNIFLPYRAGMRFNLVLALFVFKHCIRKADVKCERRQKGGGEVWVTDRD